MRRYFTTLALAVSSAWLVAPGTNAQSSETKTKVKVEDGHTVTYSGCIGSGAQTRTYVLQNVTPIGTTTTTTAGGTTTTTTYSLIPEGTVELQPSVGRRVEVTGVLIDAGHGDAEIKTKTERDGKTEKSKVEVERGPFPQMRVLSVKPTGGSC